jgi:hypothetical protein
LVGGSVQHKASTETQDNTTQKHADTHPCPEQDNYIYYFSKIPFLSQQGQGRDFFTTMSRPTLRPIHPPIQWEPGPLSIEVKWLGHEADLSPPTSVEVKNTWNYTSITPYMVWYLLKHRDNFNSTFLPISFYIR